MHQMLASLANKVCKNINLWVENGWVGVDVDLLLLSQK
jgi:hypothetical protein